MGGVLTRPAAGGDVEATPPLDVYVYPPKDGASYFGDNFMMGGEKFELPKPETFLFGENSDLHFIGSAPSEFSMGNLQSPEPTRMLHCLVNVRRDTVRLFKLADSPAEGPSYGVEFVLDADVDCNVIVHQFAAEHFSPHTPYRCISEESSSYDVSVGAAHKLCTDDTFVFSPSSVPEENLTLTKEGGGLVLHEKTVFPIVIECRAQAAGTGDSATNQTQVTLCAVARSTDSGAYVLRVLKQKLVADGLCYLLQEVYGIENKLTPADDDDEPATGADDTSGSDQLKGRRNPAADDDSRTDCVVCLCELRDTLILPCKHLCLCAACAETLRYKLGTCPICRAPFRALLHMRAMRRLNSTVSAPVIRACATTTAGGKQSACGEGGALAEAYLTTKYETVALIECLNGPVDQTQTCVTAVRPAKPRMPRAATAASACGRRARRKQPAPRSAPIQPVFTAGASEAYEGPAGGPASADCCRPTSIIIDPDRAGGRSPTAGGGAASTPAADVSQAFSVTSLASSGRPLLQARPTTPSSRSDDLAESRF